MLVIIGQFDLHPDDVPAAAELMRTLTTESRKEKGCVHYAYASDLVTPTRFQLSEEWDDEDCLKAHAQSPHVAVYRAAIAKLRVERRVVKKYQVTAAGNL